MARDRLIGLREKTAYAGITEVARVDSDLCAPVFDKSDRFALERPQLLADRQHPVIQPLANRSTGRPLGSGVLSASKSAALFRFTTASKRRSLFP
jgi:hypothetical protein